jgi:excisionase family DNA binding protein
VSPSAARLNVSRSELEALIASGKIEALPTGYTRMIPTTEVERRSKLAQLKSPAEFESSNCFLTTATRCLE